MTLLLDPTLLTRLAALDAVWVHPHIPPRKLRNARASHAIPAEETIEVLYDDTVFGGGADGVVLTAERFSFKAAFDPARPVRFAALGTVETEGKRLRVAGLEVTFAVWTPAHAETFAAVLEQLRRSEKPSWAGLLHQELTRALGSLDAAFLAPAIPERKERTARRVHGIPDHEAVLAIYDDTLFGGAKEGWVFTDRRFAWKDLFEPVDFQGWGEVCRTALLEPPADLADALPGLLEAVWPRRDLFEPRNLELEAAIRASPEALEPRLVLADWLLEQSHPRGELIGLHARAEDPLPLFLREGVALGAYGVYAELWIEWKLGFWDTVVIGPPEGQEWKAPRWLERVLTHPSARFLRGLKITGAPDLRPAAVRRTLVKMEPYRTGYSQPRVWVGDDEL